MRTLLLPIVLAGGVALLLVVLAASRKGQAWTLTSSTLSGLIFGLLAAVGAAVLSYCGAFPHPGVQIAGIYFGASVLALVGGFLIGMVATGIVGLLGRGRQTTRQRE